MLKVWCRKNLKTGVEGKINWELLEIGASKVFYPIPLILRVSLCFHHPKRLVNP